MDQSTKNQPTNQPTNLPANHTQNQRRESRLVADTPIILTILKILGEPAFAGHVIDMSGSGLRVSVPQPIPCGAEVKVEGPEMVIIGEVRQCVEHDGTYSVGLMLSEIRPR